MSDLKFTDDDLKRLKGDLTDREASLDWMYGGPDADKYSALLHRLETAERICQQTEIYVTNETPRMFLIKDLLEAWLKSKGERA